MIEVSVHYPVERRIGEPSSDKVKIEFVLPKRPLLFWDEYEFYKQIQYPKGYGIAWRDIERARLLFAPMPANILVGFSIWLWYWFRIGAARWLWKHTRKEDSNG